MANPTPRIIHAAGDVAVCAYREFFDDPTWSATSREKYEREIRRFFRWADARGLTLETINAVEVVAYATEIEAAASPQTASNYLTTIRRLFEHLVGKGVCDDNPCGSSLPDLRRWVRNSGQPVRSETMIPDLILAAGELAVTAYRKFLEDPKWSENSREEYRQHIRRFFRWAEARGLTLETINASDVVAYVAEIEAAASPQTAKPYVRTIRRLFEHLVREGACADNPCRSFLPASRRLGRTAWHPRPSLRPQDVPKLVQSAGERACEEYRAYFMGITNDGTRALRMSHVRRFFRWAEGTKLSLDRISTCDMSGYREELKREKTKKTMSDYISTIRCLFRHLVRAGVLQNNPFELPSGEDVEVVIGMPLSELERRIREYNASWQKGSPLLRAALVLLAPRAIGTTNARAISTYTGVPLSNVTRCCRWLWENGVWAINENERPLGDTSEWRSGSFLRDVHVAAGSRKRIPGVSKEI